MKKENKKWLFLGALVASLALVGCNNGGNGGGEQSKAPSSKAEKADFIPEEVDEEDLPDDPSLPMHSVTFDYPDGTDDVVVQVRHQRKVARPATDPAAPSGKKFYGWMRADKGGQVWNFKKKDLNSVMEDMTLTPLFVDASVQEQTFEAEYCPDIMGDDGTGMEGATYSGGATGKQLIGTDPLYEISASHKVGAKNAKGKYLPGGFVHFMYIKGDTLTWKLNSDVAADNVTLFMRLGAEYAELDTETNERKYSIDPTLFPIKVNGESLDYGTITFRNVPDVGQFLTFQDFFVSAQVSLKAGENVIQMIVDNNTPLRSAISATAPCVDAIRVYSSSNLTWTEETLSNMDR